MIPMFFKAFSTFTSLSFVIAIFFIKKEVALEEDREISQLLLCFFYIVVAFFVSASPLMFVSKLDDSKIGDIVQIEQASDKYLPTYLGYFFVALSIPNYTVFAFVFSILFVFVLFSRAAYFSPVFFILKYRIYHVTTQKGAKLLMITRQRKKIPSEFVFDNIKEINEFTYLDMNK